MKTVIEMSTFSMPVALRRGATSLAVLGLAFTALTGCSADGNQAGEKTQAQAASSAENETGDEHVAALTDGWAKAADSNMTSVFGSLRNTGDQPVTIESIDAGKIAAVAELHETVMNDQTGSTEMKRVEGGFEIAPGETKKLEPGGDHLMLMELQCAVQPGTDLTVKLGFDNDRTQEITVPVRDYAGAQEHYAPGEEHSGHGEHSALPSPESSALPECDER